MQHSTLKKGVLTALLFLTASPNLWASDGEYVLHRTYDGKMDLQEKSQWRQYKMVRHLNRKEKEHAIEKIRVELARAENKETEGLRPSPKKKPNFLQRIFKKN